MEAAKNEKGYKCSRQKHFKRCGDKGFAGASNKELQKTLREMTAKYYAVKNSNQAAFHTQDLCQ